jgi:hypothetical protein
MELNETRSPSESNDVTTQLMYMYLVRHESIPTLYGADHRSNLVIGTCSLFYINGKRNLIV